MNKELTQILDKFPELSSFLHNPIKTKEFNLKIRKNIFINEKSFDEECSKIDKTSNVGINNIFLFKFIINNLIKIVKIEEIEEKEIVLKTKNTTVFRVLNSNIDYLFIKYDRMIEFYKLMTHETIQQFESRSGITNKSFVIDNDKIIGYTCNLPNGEFLYNSLEKYERKIKFSIIKKLFELISCKNYLLSNLEIESIYVVMNDNEIENLIILNRQIQEENEMSEQEDFLLKKKSIFNVLGSILLNAETLSTNINTPEEFDDFANQLERQGYCNFPRINFKELLKAIYLSEKMNSLLKSLETMSWIIYESSVEGEKNITLIKKKQSLNLETFCFELKEQKTDEFKTYISESLKLQREGEHYYATSDYQKACQKYEDLLNIRRNLFGEEDIETGIAYNNLAGVLLKLSDYKKSQVCYRKALMIYEKQHGKEHQLTASVINNIGLIYDILGEYQNALLFYERSLEIKIKTLGENDCSTASSYYNIGGIHDLLGNYEVSLQHYKKALEIYDKVNGEINEDSATTHNNIALIYDKLSRLEEAITSYKRCVDISLNILGENHPLLATSYNNLGLVLFKRGEYKESIVNFNLSINIRMKLFGSDHPDTASSYNNLAGAYFKMEDFANALENYNICLNINQRICGEFFAETATAYNNLGLVYVKLKDYESALKNFKQSLKIRQSINKQAHQDTVSSLNNLGGVIYMMNKYSDCIEIYLKTLEMMTEIYGNKANIEFLHIYKNLGNCYLNINEIEQSISFYEKALSLAKSYFGIHNIKTSDCYFSLGTVYESIEDIETSREMYQKSFEIRKKLLGDNHLLTKLVEEKIK